MLLNKSNMKTAKRTAYHRTYRQENKLIGLWFPKKAYQKIEALSKQFRKKKTAFIKDCIWLVVGWSFLLLFQAETARIIQLLTRIGTNVNQIAAKVNTTNKLYETDLINLRQHVVKAIELVKNTLSDKRWLFPLIQWRLKTDSAFKKELAELLKKS